MDKQHLVPGDPILIENIVSYLKAKGIFDDFRHECLADVDTKSSCQNLSQRVDGYTTKFLATETWNPDLNKNELRNKLRRHIDESGMLAVGADHVVEQVINPKIGQLFLPKIIEVVHQFLKLEDEKLNKKKEALIKLKKATENSDVTSNKSKPVLDPIADILSFTYSKPKPIVLTPTPSAQNKSEVKVEKKKEETISQAKLSESVVKIEKKKDELITGKVQDITQKVKKEEILLPPKSQTVGTGAAEAKEEETSDLATTKAQLTDSNDDSSQSAFSQTNPVEVKIKKEIKVEDSEVPCEGQKKVQKEDVKVEKKKVEDSKLLKSEKTSPSEEASHKTVDTLTKSSSGLSKGKLDGDKKKVKSHSQQKSSEPHKVKSKETSGSSSTKSSSDKHPKPSSSSKSLKTSSKDSSPLKVISSKSSKDDGGSKSRSADMKSPDSFGKKIMPSKSSSQKEAVPGKSKHSTDKHEKHKNPKTLVHSHSDSSIERPKKSSIQYSSSYDSSQGSDQDKSSTSSMSSKEKQKHFSKHLKKESGEGSGDKGSKGGAEKKRPRADSDSGTDKKHKNGKYSSKHLLEKYKKASSITQESAKIDSRSNSLGSTSSDSQVSSSKDNLTSEDTSDNAPKQSEKKKKQAVKDSEQCKDVKALPPPPPPPPSSSMGVGTSSSAEMSSMDETQSSQESEFENEDSSNDDDDSSSDSDADNDVLDLKRDLKTPDILNDVYDIFLYSSSSSEFEGYASSPEKVQDPVASRTSDASVPSIVHTSELSSFDDEISYSDESESEGKTVKRKLTLKEAEDLLRVKAEQRRNSLKNTPAEVKLDERKALNNTLQSTTSTVSSEEEVSQRPEPKRESRRERKLNPKYASSEYASIFNSKKTSFITKQANQGEGSSPSGSPETNLDARKSDADSKRPKDKPLSGRKNLFPIPDSNHCTKPSPKLHSGQFFEAPSSPESSFILEDSNCEESSPEKSSSDKNEQHSRIALKIKMSAIKSDNQTNTDKNAHGLKRKFDGEAPTAKRPCHVDSVATESVANENEPFNNKTNSASLGHGLEQEFIQKQKANNNGDVLNKIEHARKNSYSKPNHIAENNTSD